MKKRFIIEFACNPMNLGSRINFEATEGKGFLSWRLALLKTTSVCVWFFSFLPTSNSLHCSIIHFVGITRKSYILSSEYRVWHDDDLENVWSSLIYSLTFFSIFLQPEKGVPTTFFHYSSMSFLMVAINLFFSVFSVFSMRW
jgi:hypothetical protein